jgi:hypothetical protein
MIIAELASQFPLSTGQLFGVAAVIASFAAFLFALKGVLSAKAAASHHAGGIASPSHLSPRKLPAESQPQKQALPAPPDSSIVVVIAAAVAAVIERPHRIVAISAPSEALVQFWSLEGRRQIYSSHKIR